MKLLSVVPILIVAAATCLLSEDKIQTVAGDWRLSVETPHGLMGGSLQLKQEGSKVSGTCEVEHMGTMATTGSVENAKVSLSIELPSGDTFKLLGSIDGVKMSGTTDPFGGNWTADRNSDRK